MLPVPKLLRYSEDSEPGISRHKRGKTFYYKLPNGDALQKDDALQRINALGLPPAYTDVWICIDEFGHLQATGRDEKGRKQYRYHNHWAEFRATQKFDKLVEFGEYLPSLRRRVRRDLKGSAPSKKYASAALARLIDKTSMRVGNQTYADENGSYGATTLRRKHLEFEKGELVFNYKAKGGKKVNVRMNDKLLHKTLEKIDNLPGHRVFQYISSGGDKCVLDSSDVNQYIGEEFSAKTFRTWRGTVAAFEVAAKVENPKIKEMSEAAAKELHNTPAICRTSYIHPKVIDLATASFEERTERIAVLRGVSKRGLRKYESQCLAFLKS
ncbi:DNA topoisomerase IB [Litorimonas haliclonae]|uniref:DNA topoisomerase IB n=1 Tax=Litorimonas haliclonae TaxID=2081977 RepID=UPI0039EF1518